MSVLPGVILMIIAGIGWAAVGAIVGIGSKRKISMADVQCCSSLLIVAAAVVMLCIRPDQPADGTVRFMSLAAFWLAGLLNFFMALLMQAAMSNGPNGIAWAIIQSGMVVPFLIGTFFFKENPAWSRLLGLLMLLISLVLFALARDNSVKGNRSIWLLASAMGFLIAGSNQTLVNLPSYYYSADAVSTISRTLYMQAGTFCGWLFALPFRFKKISGNFNSAMLKIAVCLAAVYLINGFFVQYYGMNMLAKVGFGAVAMPIISASCLIFFTLYSIIYLREKLTWASRIAFILCIIGVILMSLKN